MGTSFKLEENYSEKRKLKRNTLSEKYLLIFVFIICLLGIIIYFYLKNNVLFIHKTNVDKDYIYTIAKRINKTQEDTFDKIPIINISNSGVKKINNEIVNTYNKLNDNFEYDYSYEYNKYKYILSLKVVCSYFPLEGSSEVIKKFYTYNIDLRDGSIIKDKRLLSIYGLNRDRLNTFIELKFKEYYNLEVKFDYFTSKDCDYKCFLNNRGITSNYLDDTHLYINKKSLVLYKYFKRVSKYKEEDFFDDESFEILVKKRRW